MHVCIPGAVVVSSAAAVVGAEERCRYTYVLSVRVPPGACLTQIPLLTARIRTSLKKDIVAVGFYCTHRRA